MEKSSDKDKAVRLFEYLTSLAVMKSPIVRSVTSYSPDLLWFDDVPKAKECEVVRSSTYKEKISFWLKINKPSLVQRPAAPKICDDWVNKKDLDNENKEPQLSETSTVIEQVNDPEDGLIKTPVQKNLSDNPKVEEAWLNYIDSWHVWAEEEKRRQKVFKSYSTLYQMREKAARESEQYELVLAVGLLSWKTQKNVVNRHLLTIPAEITLSSVTGSLSVAPTSGTYLSFEEEMLEATEAPDRKSIAEVKEDLEMLGTDVFNGTTVNDALSVWVNNTHDKGSYSAEFKVKKDFINAPSFPTVTYSPALILRKRTQRSLVKMYDSIKTTLELEHEDKVPQNVIDLFSTEENKSNKEYTETQNSTIFFPLPSNEEQRQIVHSLNSNRGVVVQGPPGTGKSHTIANLISHLLAEGKRILVTSQTDQALKVLRDKLPENLTELCVSVVGEGKAGASDLERSLTALDRELSVNNWKQKLLNDISIATSKIESIKLERVEFLTAARKIREAEIETFGFGKYVGTASTIAVKLRTDESQNGWLKDEIYSDEINETFLTDLLETLNIISAVDRARLKQILPTSLMTPEEFSTYVEKINELKPKQLERNDKLCKELSALTLPEKEETLALINKIENVLGAVDDSTFPWFTNLSSKVLSGTMHEISALKNMTLAALNALSSEATANFYHVICADPSRMKLYIAQASNLGSFLEKGGKLKKFGRPTDMAKNNKDLLSEVTVAGHSITTSDDCQKVITALTNELIISDCYAEWGDKLELKNTSSGKLHQLQEVITLLDKLIAVSFVVNDLNKKTSSLFSVKSLKWSKEHDRKIFKNSLQYSTDQIVLKKNEGKVLELKEIWRKATRSSNPSALASQGLKAISDLSVESYAQVYKNIISFKVDQELIAKEEEKLKVLRKNAPKLYETLIKNPENPVWAERFKNFNDAKDWVYTDLQLKTFDSIHARDKVSMQLKNNEENLLTAVGSLGEKKAWLAALDRLTSTDLQHLRAYQASIKRLGKGTGKSALKEKRNAQLHMDAARGAVPAWVMPIYRIVESLKADKNAFDVIIIDEASQAGIDALFLLWMGKKIVVVGDDKQISPSVVGIVQDSVYEQQRQLLHDFPLASAFNPSNSFFDQASIRYQGRIMLREHFRCMPEIIGFSNNLMYDGKLQPLKQFGMNRLTPLKTVHVEGAEITKSGSEKNINELEAKAIVDQIVKCTKLPEYENLSMGVVSLLGTPQAKLIERLLINELGIQKMEKHNIRCSDTPGFQGDERDVIFLSMVAAPSQSAARIPALGGERYLQRFNVAASRAEQQMWLFHSVTVSDLNPDCPRSHLLQYMLNPPVAGVKTVKGKVLRDEEHPSFDSIFEQRVYLDIINRGYEVVPQWETLGRRIDLVIVGENARLAVECDGDKWHGPERYEQDMARERDLQRVGWEFFRVRGSDYYRNEKEALSSLWPMLKAKNILPKKR